MCHPCRTFVKILKVFNNKFWGLEIIWRFVFFWFLIYRQNAISNSFSEKDPAHAVPGKFGSTHAAVFAACRKRQPRLGISWKVASCDTLVIIRIGFRHDHCKRQMLDKVDGNQNVHHELFSSHLANYEILLQSGARWQIWGVDQTYLHKYWFFNKCLV